MGKSWTESELQAASEAMQKAGYPSLEEFTAALENGRTCPVCGELYTAPPAISRKDNKTEICPVCGVREALDAAPLTDDQKAEIIATVKNLERGRL